MKVQGEEKFGIPTQNFAISASTSGYTLAYSADGESFTEWSEPTPAGEVLVVSEAAKGMTYKLVGNTDVVYVQF